jgi:sugar transferase (PEP-CTERM/EpsH1 system associated)
MEKGIATVIRNTSDLFEHSILCLGTSGESERLLPLGTQVIELYKAPGNSPHFLLKLALKIRSLRPDIIHTRCWGGTDGIIAARLAGIHAVVHGEHGWGIDDAEGQNAKRLKIRHFLSRWVREYTCVSEHQKNWLLQAVKVNKPVTQIYNGVDTQIFRPNEGGHGIRIELGIPPQAFVVGIVGRLDPIKNHLVAFQAFAKLLEVAPDARLLVVGDGPERERLERLAGKQVLFLGNRLDVPAVLQALNIFVLPSLNEGISNTILEAMAAGLPVIATRVGGNSELVEEHVTGVLIAPNDAAAIAAELIRYATSEELVHLHGNQGRMRVTQLFTIHKMIEGYEQVYRRIASV